MTLSALLQPIRVGGIMLPSRVVMGSMHTGLEGHPERFAELVRRYDQGQASLDQVQSAIDEVKGGQREVSAADGKELFRRNVATWCAYKTMWAPCPTTIPNGAALTPAASRRGASSISVRPLAAQCGHPRTNGRTRPSRSE